MRARPTVLAFLLGVVLGAAGAWLALGGASVAPVADGVEGAGPAAAGPAATDGRALSARGAGRTAADAAGTAPSSSPSARPSEAPAPAPLADDAEPPPLPTIEVAVARGDGIPDDWSGTAYALPAGASGVDDAREASHAAVGLETPATFPVVAPGRYDVGVVWPGAWVLVRDVEVVAGGPTRVDVALPASAPVRVVATAEASGAAEEGRVGGRVRLAPAGEGVARRYPGRDERAAVAAEVSLETLPGTGDSSPLPRQTPYEVECSLHRVIEFSFGGGSMTALMDGPSGQRLVATPTTTHGGGEVRVTPEKLSTWRLRWRCEPAAWPRERLRVRHQVTVPGAPAPVEGQIDRETKDLSAPVEESERYGPAGTWRVRWSGVGVVPGETTVTLGAGQETTTEVVLRFDPTAGADEDLAVDVGRVVPPGASVAVAGFVGAGSDASAVGDSFVAPRGALALGSRRWAGVVVYSGDRVSRPASPPGTGEWRPPLEVGGFVAVVTDPHLEPALGGLTVRRADGGILLRRHAEAHGGAEWARELGVEPGTLLGPFPPGEVVLEARLAGTTLPPASIAVRAGRVTTWTVRWR